MAAAVDRVTPVPFPKRPRKLPTVLSSEEVARLIDSARNSEVHTRWVHVRDSIEQQCRHMRQGDALCGRAVLVRFTDGTQISICIGVEQLVEARYCKGDTPDNPIWTRQD